MGIFLYFVETKRNLLNRDQVGPVLASRLLNFASTAKQVNGPEGKRGVLIFEGEVPSARCKYQEDRQRWIKWGDTPAGPAWVGVWEDDKPGPKDLQRSPKEFLRGHAIELEDGNQWVVPTIMYSTDQLAVPSTIGMNDQGELVKAPLPIYADVIETGRKVLNMMMVLKGFETADPTIYVREADQFRWIVDVLALNYRVGLPEVSLLEILSDRNFPLCTYAAVGFDLLKRLEEISKKKESV